MQPQILTFNTFSEVDGFLIPAFQRRLDNEVVNEIAIHIKEQRAKNSYPYLGCIEIVEYDGNKYIIDGQHRYEAYRKDWKNNDKPTLITVMIHTVDSYSEMVKIFKLRNTNQEVPRYIISCCDENERQLMIKIEEYLMSSDGVMKKETKRPYVNILKFMDDLLKENVLAENGIDSFEKFKTFFKVKNRAIRDSCRNERFLKRNKITESMLTKAENFGLYIGLINSFWFYFDHESNV